MKKLVILVSGKMKSGKNTFANIAKEYLEELFTSNLEPLVNKTLTYNDYGTSGRIFEENRTIKVELMAFANQLKNNCKEDFKILQESLNSYADELLDKMNKDGFQISEELLKDINKLKISDENWFEDKTFITRNILQVVGTEIMRKRNNNDNYWIDILKDKCKNSLADVIIVTDTRYVNEIENMYDDDYNLITVRLMKKSKESKNSKEHSSENDLDNYSSWYYIIDNTKNSLKSFTKQVKMVINEIKDIYLC